MRSCEDEVERGVGLGRAEGLPGRPGAREISSVAIVVRVLPLWEGCNEDFGRASGLCEIGSIRSAYCSVGRVLDLWSVAVW